MTITVWTLIALRGTKVNVETFATKEEAMAELNREYETVRDQLQGTLTCDYSRSIDHTDAIITYRDVVIGHWTVKGLIAK